MQCGTPQTKQKDFVLPFEHGNKGKSSMTENATEDKCEDNNAFSLHLHPAGVDTAEARRRQGVNSICLAWGIRISPQLTPAGVEAAWAICRR